MDRRNLTGIELAEKVGITPTSVSRILNGVSRPRQGTLTKLIEVLCLNADDQQMVIKGYTGLPDAVEEEPPAVLPVENFPAAELDRVARYLEMKTLAIDFRESVSRTLSDGAIEFVSYARTGSVVTDFLITGGARIAVECKFNVQRDWERETATALLLRRQLPCDCVLIVVPYLNDQSRAMSTNLAAIPCNIVTPSDLCAVIRQQLKQPSQP
jgi:transcriptional regulator with XRE-family HTH domain